MKIEKTSAEKSMEEQRMRDILLLLEHLAQRETITVNLILDRLYDIGSVNLINKKFRSRSLKKMMKLITKTSKPVFKVIALRWFQKNGPKLIADLLHEKVSFPQEEDKPEKEVQLQVYSLPEGENQAIEVVKRLQSRVRVLTGMLIGAIAVCGGSFFWFFSSF